jgi:hypothetical protein
MLNFLYSPKIKIMKLPFLKCLLTAWFFMTLISVSQAQNWSTLDAVCYNGSTDKYYFFYGKHFVIKERGKPIDGLPILITEDFDGFPAKWGGGDLDAVCYSQDNEAYYFFRGDEYSKKPLGKRMEAPQKINSAGGFPGLPWSRIDAVCYNAKSEKYFFFNGAEYCVKERGKPVDGTRRSISADWFNNQPVRLPIRDVAFSNDNSEYYFFWDDAVAAKPMGKNTGAPKSYTAGGFEWRERSENNFIGICSQAGFISYCTISWESGGSKKNWSKNGVALAASFSEVIKLPKDATNIKISIYQKQLVAKSITEYETKKKEFFDKSMQYPPNRWYTVEGTTFNPSCDVGKSKPFSAASVGDFFTKDVVDGFNDAIKFIADKMNDVNDQIVRSKAIRDAQRLETLITQFANDAIQAAKDQETINGLYRVSRQKSSNVGKDVMVAIARHPAFRGTMGLVNSFKSFSVGFSAGASAIIGIDGSFGYAIDIPGLNTNKGYAGLDVSGGAQTGAGLGCQFGIWTSPPNQLNGLSVAVNVEVGSTVGVGISIVYNVNPNASGEDMFTFAGVVVAPGVGVGIGASVGSGYSWVY